MRAIASRTTMSAAPARIGHRRGPAASTAPVAHASAAPGAPAKPTAIAARWGLGPTGLRMTWRLAGAPLVDHRADEAAPVTLLRRPMRLPAPSPDAA
jgi:hypothetical protein